MKYMTKERSKELLDQIRMKEARYARYKPLITGLISIVALPIVIPLVIGTAVCLSLLDEDDKYELWKRHW